VIAVQEPRKRTREVRELRTFLREVQERFPGALLEIDNRVDSRFQISAVLLKLERMHKFPITVFHHTTNALGDRSELPLITNLFASRELCGMALGTTGERLAFEYGARCGNPIPPEVVAPDEAPVKEVRITGGDVDVRQLPVPLPYHMEGGRTILGSLLTTVDRETGSVYNCAFQTMRIIDATHVTAGLGDSTHNFLRYCDYKERGEPTPIVAWIGHHPAACMGGLTRTPIDQDEYAVTGGVLGEPLRVTPSETWGDRFLVPADAEIVIEGLVSPTEWGRHGLRADYARYYDAESLHPLVEITAITRRRDAYYHNIHLGGRDQANLGGIPLEGTIFNAVKQAVPGVRNVHLPASGCGRFHAYIQIKKRAVGEGQAAICATLPLDKRIKHVVVVDDDVDIFDDAEVLWAIATRSRWDRDLVVIPNMPSINRDPTAHSIELSPEQWMQSVAKGGIDATKPAPPEPFEIRIKVPDEVMEATDLETIIGRQQLDAVRSEV
jgi:2,5-furandicarboxylate decarboxylase 1